jgi:hypothetical protein
MRSENRIAVSKVPIMPLFVSRLPFQRSICPPLASAARSPARDHFLIRHYLLPSLSSKGFIAQKYGVPCRRLLRLIKPIRRDWLLFAVGEISQAREMRSEALKVRKAFVSLRRITSTDTQPRHRVAPPQQPQSLAPHQHPRHSPPLRHKPPDSHHSTADTAETSKAPCPSSRETAD